MKVIALLPFKNEEWCLPAYLHNTSVIADEIIAIDDGSTDNSLSDQQQFAIFVTPGPVMTQHAAGLP